MQVAGNGHGGGKETVKEGVAERRSPRPKSRLPSEDFTNPFQVEMVHGKYFTMTSHQYLMIVNKMLCVIHFFAAIRLLERLCRETDSFKTALYFIHQ
jgi:hypothetical protein